MRQEVIANTCIHCGCLQGNWFIRDDLIDFMSEENLEKLVDKKLPNNLTREDLRVEPEEPKPIEFRLRIGHIHHKDLNWENDDPNNLILLCEDCHNKLHALTGKTSASTSRKQAAEEARLRREKKQADKWRKNYYAMKNQTRIDSPSELFKKRVTKRHRAKHSRY